MNTRASERLALKAGCAGAGKRRISAALPAADRPQQRQDHRLQALIRWIHPELGMVPPLKFIPVAEESKLIPPIGEWCCTKPAARIAEWQQGFAARW